MRQAWGRARRVADRCSQSPPWKFRSTSTDTAAAPRSIAAAARRAATEAVAEPRGTRKPYSGVAKRTSATRREAGVHAPPVVADHAGLAVHQTRRAHDFAAVGLGRRLMPETDAKHRQVRGRLSNELDEHARVLGATRSRRQDETPRLQRQ